jgi:hypothetical protein
MTLGELLGTAVQQKIPDEDQRRIFRIRAAGQEHRGNVDPLRGRDPAEVWRDIRLYIQHEDGLINIRTTWFLTINGFLYAALAITVAAEVQNGLSPVSTAFAQLVIAVVGVTVSITTSQSVSAAYGAIKELKNFWTTYYEPLDAKLNRRPIFPFIVGGGDKRRIARRGRISTRWLPLVIGTVWAGVMGVAIGTIHKNWRSSFAAIDGYWPYVLGSVLFAFAFAKSVRPKVPADPAKDLGNYAQKD